MVQFYSSTDMAIVWMKFHFILPDFHMVDHVSITVLALPMRMLASLLFDKIT